MVNISSSKTLSNTHCVTICIGKIGKSGKPIKNTFESENEMATKVHISRFMRKKVSECLRTFTNVKEQRSVHAKQSIFAFKAIATLKDEVRALSLADGDFWLKLKKNVIPAVEQVVTPNVQSRYYQYDKDVLTFLKEALKPFQNVNL